ncbi:MAG TPA: hypothetical protein ENN78_01435 [Candidatus Omnitrophica bacterium]|nr:hypothetical protein [Candidatus Omnitrophota bacterium]
MAQTNIRKERLPQVKDIIKTKKNKIKSNLESIVASGLQSEYLDMSKELLDKNNPEDILAALLQYSFKGELDEKRYVEIEDAIVDKKGKTRLFVGQGKQDGLNAKKLAKIIQDRCAIPNYKIQDIQVLDRFSFVSLTFNDAERVLGSFRKDKGKAGLFIEKAKEKKLRGK